MKRMNNLKNVIAARIMGGLVIGMTAVAGVAPVTVFAQSQEAECICEEKCSQDSKMCIRDRNHTCSITFRLILNQVWIMGQGKSLSRRKGGNN